MTGIASAAALAALIYRIRGASPPTDPAPIAAGVGYTLGPNAVLTPWAASLLTALVSAGAPPLYVTSCLRRPEDQARAMAGRIRDYGAQSVIDLYRADVSKVVAAYPDLDAMTSEVEAVGASLSRHLIGEAVDIVPPPGSAMTVEDLRVALTPLVPAGFKILDESGVCHFQRA